MSFVDMTGKRFGRYTVIARAENSKDGCARWICKCDCGNVKTVLGQSLRRGSVVSCGCFHREDLISRLTTHGKTKTRIRNIWNHMKQRCNNPNDNAYRYYGGRGISISQEWADSFQSFYDWAYANGYSDDLTLDRIDTNKNYEPSNCRWVSRKIQQNNRRGNQVFSIKGEQKTIAEWCAVYGVPHERVRHRVVDEGWDILKALTTPPLNRNGVPK